MSVAVLIPFTGTCPHRSRARAHITEHYRSIGDWLVFTGSSGEPWCKARAVDDAVRQSDAEMLVVADADCICDGIHDAIAAVTAGAPWAIPHTIVHRLDLPATEAVYDGAHPNSTTGRTERPYTGTPGGGIVVLRRTVYDRVPLDPRFQGWGQEDAAWARALTCLAGPPRRFAHDLWHLWHPPAERMNRRIGSPQSRALCEQYGRARRKPEQMQQLVTQARALLTASTNTEETCHG